MSSIYEYVTISWRTKVSKKLRRWQPLLIGKSFLSKNRGAPPNERMSEWMITGGGVISQKLSRLWTIRAWSEYSRCLLPILALSLIVLMEIGFKLIQLMLCGTRFVLWDLLFAFETEFCWKYLPEFFILHYDKKMNITQNHIYKSRICTRMSRYRGQYVFVDT